MKKYIKAEITEIEFVDDVVTSSLTGKDGTIEGEENDKWD